MKKKRIDEHAHLSVCGVIHGYSEGIGERVEVEQSWEAGGHRLSSGDGHLEEEDLRAARAVLRQHGRGR